MPIVLDHMIVPARARTESLKYLISISRAPS